jgi:hypothetical protein
MVALTSTCKTSPVACLVPPTSSTSCTPWKASSPAWPTPHTRRHDLDGEDLRTAVEKVADYREARLAPLAEVLDGYAAIAQNCWAAWRRKNRIDDRLPENFSEILQATADFFDPILPPGGSQQTWIANARAWT